MYGVRLWQPLNSFPAKPIGAITAKPPSATPLPHPLTHVDDAKTWAPNSAASNVLSSPRDATIRVEFYCKREFRRREDLRILTALPHTRTGGHTEGSLR